MCYEAQNVQNAGNEVCAECGNQGQVECGKCAECRMQNTCRIQKVCRMWDAGSEVKYRMWRWKVRREQELR